MGPGPIEDHIGHATGFAAGWPAGVPGRVLDLGSGGGLPGLVLLLAWPDARFVLLDAGQRRAGFLVEAVQELAAQERATVLRARAEEVGRSGAHRGAYDCVVARSFGPPAVTAECAAPLLRVGGRLIVSEPPTGEGRARWPGAPLAGLGLRVAETVDREHRYQVLETVRPCPDRFPRRTGVPAKRPLF